jgi:hypothetical protein
VYVVTLPAVSRRGEGGAKERPIRREVGKGEGWKSRGREGWKSERKTLAVKRVACRLDVCARPKSRGRGGLLTSEKACLSQRWVSIRTEKDRQGTLEDRRARKMRRGEER